MIPQDDLEPGLWIAVTGIPDDENDQIDSPFGPIRRRAMFDGTPLEVIAVSLPFVAVTDGQNVFAIDTRTVVFTRMHKSYVKAMLTRMRRETPPNTRMRQVIHSRQEPDAKDPRCCPRCFEGRLRKIMTAGASVWMKVCPVCGFEKEDTE